MFGVKVMGNGNLVISNVKAHHSGVYLCRATTPRTRNFTTAVANLTVLGEEIVFTIVTTIVQLYVGLLCSTLLSCSE